MACVFGLFMAWGIGANDVANAMGTSVGSGAITIKDTGLNQKIDHKICIGCAACMAICPYDAIIPNPFGALS